MGFLVVDTDRNPVITARSQGHLHRHNQLLLKVSKFSVNVFKSLSLNISVHL
jgi:hypothetical protein